jgi:hypothetical protein
MASQPRLLFPLPAVLPTGGTFAVPGAGNIGVPLTLLARGADARGLALRVGCWSDPDGTPWHLDPITAEREAYLSFLWREVHAQLAEFTALQAFTRSFSPEYYPESVAYATARLVAAALRVPVDESEAGPDPPDDTVF